MFVTLGSVSAIVLQGLLGGVGVQGGTGRLWRLPAALSFSKQGAGAALPEAAGSREQHYGLAGGAGSE